MQFPNIYFNQYLSFYSTRHQIHARKYVSPLL